MVIVLLFSYKGLVRFGILFYKLCYLLLNFDISWKSFYFFCFFLIIRNSVWGMGISVD